MAAFFIVNLFFVLLAPTLLISPATAATIAAPIPQGVQTALITAPPPTPTPIRRAAAAAIEIPSVPKPIDPEPPSAPETPSEPEPAPIAPPEPPNPGPANPAAPASPKQTLEIDGEDYVELAESILDALTELAGLASTPTPTAADLTTTSTFYGDGLGPTETVVYWFAKVANATASGAQGNYTQPTPSSVAGQVTAAAAAVGVDGLVMAGVWLGWVAVSVAVAGFAVGLGG